MPRTGGVVVALPRTGAAAAELPRIGAVGPGLARTGAPSLVRGRAGPAAAGRRGFDGVLVSSGLRAMGQGLQLDQGNAAARIAVAEIARSAAGTSAQPGP